MAYVFDPAKGSAVALLRLLPFLFPAIFISSALAGSIYLLYGAVALHVAIIGCENTVGRYLSSKPIPSLVPRPCRVQFEDCCLLAWPAGHLAAFTAALTLIAWTNPTTRQIFAIGAIFGYSINVFSATVGHELVHRRSQVELFCSDFLYAAMLYPHFPTVHLASHHRWAGSDRDCQTPRVRQQIYPFLFQALSGGLRIISSHGITALDPRLTWRVVAVGVCMAAVALVGSLPAVTFLLVQGLFSFILVETINYIQHYRQTAPDSPDGYHRPASQDENFVSRIILFNLPLHAAHHRNETIHYFGLTMTAGAPTYGWGYWTSFWLAWAPPLWEYCHAVRSREGA